MISGGTRTALRIPLAGVEKYLELAALVGLALLVYSVPAGYISLPEIVPTHFGFNGKPDAWGSRSVLFMTPALGLFMYLSLTIISRFLHTLKYPAKTRENVERHYMMARRLLYWVKAEIIWMLVFLQWELIRVGLNSDKSISTAGAFSFVLVVIFTTLWHRRQIFRLK